MNTIAGALFFASRNRSRTRAAPSPTNISMNSEALMEKNATPDSPATARASSVLPVPGGPISKNAPRHLAAQALEAIRLLEKLHDLLQIALGGLQPRDVVEGDVHRRRLVELATLVLAHAAERIARSEHRLRPRDIHTQNPMISAHGSSVSMTCTGKDCCWLLTSICTPF